MFFRSWCAPAQQIREREARVPDGFALEAGSGANRTKKAVRHARERRVAKVAGASFWAAFGERPQPCPDVRPGTFAALAFAVAFGVGLALAL